MSSNLRGCRRCCRQPPYISHGMFLPCLLRARMWPRSYRNRVDHIPRHARNSSSALFAHLCRYYHQRCSPQEDTQCGFRLHRRRVTAWVFFRTLLGGVSVDTIGWRARWYMCAGAIMVFLLVGAWTIPADSAIQPPTLTMLKRILIGREQL